MGIPDIYEDHVEREDTVGLVARKTISKIWMTRRLIEKAKAVRQKSGLASTGAWLFLRKIV